MYPVGILAKERFPTTVTPMNSSHKADLPSNSLISATMLTLLEQVAHQVDEAKARSALGW